METFSFRFGFAATAIVALLGASCVPGIAQNPASSQPAPAMPAAATPAFQPTGATANLAPNDPPGEWARQARDYANTRYTTLHQITEKNVGRLRVAWTFSDGTQYGHEGAPLVIGNTMYLVTPFPNVAYALDLSKPGAPIKWSYDPHPSAAAVGKACCDAVIRGWAYADGKLIYNVLDGHTIALDAKTGKLVWRIKMSSIFTGATMTMAPFVVGNKVFVGNSGGEMGVFGWIAALDVDTGKELWRAYSTGPDSLVKIGKDFHPYYSWMRGKDLGVASWPAGAWKHGGAAVWGWISYDPELNLIYYGTSNPSPRVPSQRPGLNLWSSSVFARNPDTGMAKWAFQFTPHDQWDYDATNENVLINVPIGGKMHKALVQLNRNGFGYTIDRETGQVLVAQPFGHINWATGVDMKTGQPIINHDKQPKVGIEIRDICPTDIGVKDWEPSAFSPRTGLIYAGTLNVCMDLTDHKQSYIAGTPYDGMEMKRHAGPGGNWGAFIAWDPVHGRQVWSIKEKFMTMSGALATATDLVFYGTVDGWFRAVNARTGQILWSQRLGSGVLGQPIAYKGPDGREYIAIDSGVGGAAMVSDKMDGFPARGNTLYVFSIDGDSLENGPGLKVTESTAPAVIPRSSNDFHHR
ncbi:MAG: PQQ-dependent dehydrogenase, methanol/ethanol family [Acetobacteraceae bacterium]